MYWYWTNVCILIMRCWRYVSVFCHWSFPHSSLMPSLSVFLLFQEPIKSRAPQLHLEYRFYKQLGNSGKHRSLSIIAVLCGLWKATTSSSGLRLNVSQFCAENYGGGELQALMWLLHPSAENDSERRDGEIKGGYQRLPCVEWVLRSKPYHGTSQK